VEAGVGQRTAPMLEVQMDQTISDGGDLGDGAP